MTRPVPVNAETREFPAAAVVAYYFQSANGPAFIAYKGRQSKPAQRVAFGSVERRDEQLAEYVKRETAREGARQQRQQAAHGLEVGDILYSTWGYEQTNVTFYQLTRIVSGRSAMVRQIEADTIESKPGSMTGTTTPRPGEFVAGSKDEMRRATGWQTLGAGKSSHGDLEKWDGRPRNVSSYA